MPTERSPDELETCRCKNRPKPLDAMDREILEFFSSDMVYEDGLTPEIGLSTTAEMVDVTIEDEGDATANIGLAANADSLDIFEVEALEEVAMGQVLEVVPNKQQPKQRTNKSCVEEASSLIENHHAQLKEILERQHKEHMGVLNGIHDTLRALLETMTGATVA
ncbi:uncharacterized protein LOC125776747 isoform X3 [Bactrocera dorsalis]|uniref:Uncharacterized protein LOC125776747 isoform X3 n=1 Tax=Bactrocera dorsalis TaxID=27457 RepID=A0ABM3JAK2_BACDO|nr:uncharacterized protein LOC125776747 isoform X3 [Bactrocera dorsalis]